MAAPGDAPQLDIDDSAQRSFSAWYRKLEQVSTKIGVLPAMPHSRLASKGTPSPLHIVAQDAQVVRFFDRKVRPLQPGSL